MQRHKRWMYKHDPSYAAFMDQNEQELRDVEVRRQGEIMARAMQDSIDRAFQENSIQLHTPPRGTGPPPTPGAGSTPTPPASPPSGGAGALASEPELCLHTGHEAGHRERRMDCALILVSTA